jgi:ABC-type lipoprotein export system ATPase subunit
VVDENSNIEIVDVAREAREILVGVMRKGEGDGPSSSASATLLALLSVDDIQPQISALVQSVLPCPFPTATASADPRLQAEVAVYKQICEYVSSTTAHFIVYSASCNEQLTNAVAALSPPLPPAHLWHYVVSTSSSAAWQDCVAPYITPITPEEEEQEPEQVEEESGDGGELAPPPLNAAEIRVATELRRRALANQPDREHEEATDSANDLCNIEFSLAFGGKILLHNANLKLGKGHMYGIMGKNGAGKTTLLTNIGSGNIEGLPETLKTVYVQHDDQSLNDAGLSVLDEVMEGSDMVEAEVQREDASRALTDIGFTEVMLTSPRSALSGGWKMKLLIIRAMLSRADILLLDEPTNHLDTGSVDWLAEYLQAQKKVH